jgi:hypothetical protein
MKNQNKRRNGRNVSVIEERSMTAYKEYREGGNENGDWLHGALTCECIFPQGRCQYSFRSKRPFCCHEDEFTQPNRVNSLWIWIRLGRMGTIREESSYPQW